MRRDQAGVIFALSGHGGNPGTQGWRLSSGGQPSWTVLSQGLCIEFAQPRVRGITRILVQSSEQAMAYYGLRVGVVDWSASRHRPYLCPELRHVRCLARFQTFKARAVRQILELVDRCRFSGFGTGLKDLLSTSFYTVREPKIKV